MANDVCRYIEENGIDKTAERILVLFHSMLATKEQCDQFIEMAPDSISQELRMLVRSKFHETRKSVNHSAMEINKEISKFTGVDIAQASIESARRIKDIYASLVVTLEEVTGKTIVELNECVPDCLNISDEELFGMKKSDCDLLEALKIYF